MALIQEVSLAVGDGEWEVGAVTENFSPIGILLATGQLISVGSSVGLLLVVPPPVGSEIESRRMRCVGRVVRVEEALQEGKFVMAIGFQRFEEVGRA